MACFSFESVSMMMVLMTSVISVVGGVSLRNLPDSYEWNKSSEKSEVSLGGMSGLRLRSSRMFPFADTGSHIRPPTVDHFARHGLCGQDKGKQHFYKALKSALCQIKDNFAASMVEDLCKKTERYMLTKWVGELFDRDGDGYITHYERTHYGNDD